MPAGGASVLANRFLGLGMRLRMAFVDAGLAQQQEVGGQRHGRDQCGEEEQRPPAVAVLDQQPHLLARQRIADQVADAQDAEDRAVGGVVEPLGGHLDEPGPAERLRQAVADPREREQRQAARQAEEQREQRGAADADEKVAPSAPVVPEPGEEELAERVGEHAQRGDAADAHQRLVMADAVRAQLLDQQRRRDRQVGAAVVTGRVAGEQQHQGADLPGTQRLGRCRHGN